MASVTEPRQNVETPHADERLVDEQIKQTRRALKLVDLTAGMITLAIGVIVFLSTAAVLEHWVIPGGWSSTARAVLFGILVLGTAGYVFRVLWPLLRQPINEAYAAQTIEQSSPALKNSLLNFLLLRNRKRLISRQVFQAIEQQAAQGLSKISLDSVIDRSAILRLGLVLLGVVAVCALYLVLSPKDLVASAGRVLLPWTNVAVPSRVQLNDIMPGDTQAARGDQIEISVEVLGLDEEEPVRLLYSTADKQIVRQEIPMTAAAGSVLFEAKLPGPMAEGGGLQQDLSYWIEAGDARSEPFQVAVFARPTLVVQSIRYNYPDYTGYPSREEAHTGDISAVEGTLVTITAISNQPIQSGYVDFEANGRHDLLMKVEEERQTTVSFPLELREDRRTPRHQSYMLRYTTTEGRKNKLPPKYQIDVTPDYSPEIRLLMPEEEVVDVLIDEQVTIEVEARDPDFAVRQVAILGEVAGEQVLKERLLTKNHTGKFVGQMELSPSKLGLKVGDVLQYWGAAADNRRPKANLAFTNRHKIRVVGPDEAGQQNSDGQGKGEPASAGGDEQNEQNESDKGRENGSEESGESAGESGAEGQPGQGQAGAGEEGEGMSDEQNQQQGGQAGEGESNEDNEDSQADADGQAGGNSEGEQEKNEDSENKAGESGSDSSAGNSSRDQEEKVSPDGDDDGTAFDRIAEHFDEQEGEDASEQSEMNEQNSGGEEQRENKSNAADGKADTDQSNHDENGEPASGENVEPTSGESGEPASAGGSQAEDPNAEGDQQQGEEQAPAGKMPQEQDLAGGGEESGNQEGAPEPKGEKSPQEKQGKQGASGDQEEPSDSKDQSESDTKGSDGGDRSGEGDKGSGQESEGAGTGGQGEHQAADEGGGEADQSGEGNMAAKPGGEKQAEGETGKSSQDQPGNGSEEGGQSGQQSGGESQGEKGGNQGEKGQSKQGAAGEDSPSEGEPSDQESSNVENSSSPAGQEPSGGGQNSNSSPPPPGEIQPGDEADLDYARKQTDLILDKLDDQLKKKKTDEKLLEKLGWSKDELRRFVDRWKHLKKQATGEAASATAQQKLDDALRSLGLGRNRRTGFRSQTAKDKLRELQDSYRVQTPLEYQQRVRAYIKGTAAAEEK